LKKDHKWALTHILYRQVDWTKKVAEWIIKKSL